MTEEQLARWRQAELIRRKRARRGGRRRAGGFGRYLGMQVLPPALPARPAAAITPPEQPDQEGTTP
ncbi:hypothetical protein [Jiangella alkaliphila]|uniref:Uncharacterized protein n=1 Tax=Jiangella alkaliphila TaxID=419479 RepID=A0A1H2IDU3_9ACTN|nr:hypothetical protein [Jiangella alkaliphila]SDU42234.1 hypothetical protein SAMN04488563_1635 [Jiangella alkaliphila]